MIVLVQVLRSYPNIKKNDVVLKVPIELDSSLTFPYQKVVEVLQLLFDNKVNKPIVEFKILQ